MYYIFPIISLLLLGSLPVFAGSDVIYIPKQENANKKIHKVIICEPYDCEHGYVFNEKSKPKYYDPLFSGYYIDSPLYNTIQNNPMNYLPNVYSKYGRK